MKKECFVSVLLGFALGEWREDGNFEMAVMGSRKVTTEEICRGEAGGGVQGQCHTFFDKTSRKQTMEMPI
jgi:hypothetical protein